jgi:hypothetical protein
MQKQYLLFLLCSKFFGSVSAMEHELKALEHELKGLSIQRAVSPPLAIPHLMIPQLRGYSDEEQSKHAYSPVRNYAYSPDDSKSLVLLITAASFAHDYLPNSRDYDDWPSQ